MRNTDFGDSLHEPSKLSANNSDWYLFLSSDSKGIIAEIGICRKVRSDSVHIEMNKNGRLIDLRPPRNQFHF